MEKRNSAVVKIIFQCYKFETHVRSVKWLNSRYLSLVTFDPLTLHMENWGV